jgi:hypothetical protein
MGSTGRRCPNDVAASGEPLATGGRRLLRGAQLLLPRAGTLLAWGARSVLGYDRELCRDAAAALV